MALVDEYSFRKERDPCPFAGKTVRAKGCVRLSNLQANTRGTESSELIFEDCLESIDSNKKSNSNVEVDQVSMDKIHKPFAWTKEGALGKMDQNDSIFLVSSDGVVKNLGPCHLEPPKFDDPEVQRFDLRISTASRRNATEYALIHSLPNVRVATCNISPQVNKKPVSLVGSARVGGILMDLGKAKVVTHVGVIGAEPSVQRRALPSSHGGAMAWCAEQRPAGLAAFDLFSRDVGGGRWTRIGRFYGGPDSARESVSALTLDSAGVRARFLRLVPIGPGRVHTDQHPAFRVALYGREPAASPPPGPSSAVAPCGEAVEARKPAVRATSRRWVPDGAGQGVAWMGRAGGNGRLGGRGAAVKAEVKEGMEAGGADEAWVWSDAWRGAKLRRDAAIAARAAQEENEDVALALVLSASAEEFEKAQLAAALSASLEAEGAMVGECRPACGETDAVAKLDPMDCSFQIETSASLDTAGPGQEPRQEAADSGDEISKADGPSMASGGENSDEKGGEEQGHECEEEGWERVGPAEADWDDWGPEDDEAAALWAEEAAAGGPPAEGDWEIVGSDWS